MDLANVGLLNDFRRSPSVSRATSQFKQRTVREVEAAAKGRAGEACNGPCGPNWSSTPSFNFSLSDTASTDVTRQKCLFSLGNGQLKERADCVISANCYMRVFCFSCSLSYSYRDLFRDPADIFDWFQGEFEILGSEPYPIVANWSEQVMGCNSF